MPHRSIRLALLSIPAFANLATANKPSPLGQPSLVLGEPLRRHWLTTGPSLPLEAPGASATA